MNKRRRDQVPRLDQALSAAQSRRLLKWLHVDQLSYAEAVKRLRDQFGIETNIGHIFRFYQRHCAARPSVPTRNGKPVLLDLRIYPRGKSWQFIIMQRQPSLRVFIQGRQLKPIRRHLSKS